MTPTGKRPQPGRNAASSRPYKSSSRPDKGRRSAKSGRPGTSGGLARSGRDRDARERRNRDSLDTPVDSRRRWWPFKPRRSDDDAFGKGAEAIARGMGTPHFLVAMTVIVVVWLAWNTLMPEHWQFDPRSLNFTLLTLILSLQASYASPLLLLAQNRQEDRDRVGFERDRQNADRNHATTEFITREIAAMRLGLQDVATRDFVRGELHDALEDLEERAAATARAQVEAELRAQLEREYTHRLEMTLAARGIEPDTEREAGSGARPGAGASTTPTTPPAPATDPPAHAGTPPAPKEER